MIAIRLKTNDLTDPLGIDIVDPGFSWNCEGGKKQTAFRLLLTDEAGQTVGDSGKVSTDRMHCRLSDLTDKKLSSREYSDIAYTGSFTCSNEKINTFVNNTIRSMKGNFVDIPTDCPQREKSGWDGDAQLFAATSAWLGDSKLVYRKWLRAVRDCQEADGTIRNVSPWCGKPGDRADALNGSTGWADACVIVPYTFWKQTGDVSWITDNLEMMLRWRGRHTAGAFVQPLFAGRSVQLPVRYGMRNSCDR